jgi:hypothetical protein
VNSSIRCDFLDRRTNSLVDGIIRPTTSQDMLLWANWRYKQKDQDKDWDWWGLFLDARSSPRHECFSAITRTGLQGLMLLDLKPTEPNLEPVVIDYLCTNPANRYTKRGLARIGVGLVAAAVVRSFEHGAQGRLWLESLKEAERFYEDLGMVRQHVSSSEGNCLYSLDSATAKELLEKMRTKGILKG